MSSEHQQYSLENQSAAIQRYAESHSFEVIRSHILRCRQERPRSGEQVGNRQLLIGTNCITTITSGCGTVFEITPSGTVTSLYSFCSKVTWGLCADGSNPTAALTQGADGNFYGTTLYGGANAADNNCFCGGYGTVFKLSPAGQLTTLYQFCNVINSSGVCLDGALPFGGLLQASNGKLYGTTYSGGAHGKGIVLPQVSSIHIQTVEYGVARTTDSPLQQLEA